jgi:hypothetical protein
MWYRRNGSASERIPAPARCNVAGDNQKVGCVARETVNGRGDDNIAGGEGLHQLFKLRPVGRGAGDFLAEYFFASGRLQLALIRLGRRSRRGHSRKSRLDCAS